jgi:hypothetical protein
VHRSARPIDHNGEARRNLRYFHMLDADVRSMTLNPFPTLWALLQRWQADGSLPTFLNASSPVGIAG